MGVLDIQNERAKFEELWRKGREQRGQIVCAEDHERDAVWKDSASANEFFSLQREEADAAQPSSIKMVRLTQALLLAPNPCATMSVKLIRAGFLWMARDISLAV